MYQLLIAARGRIAAVRPTPDPGLPNPSEALPLQREAAPLPSARILRPPLRPTGLAGSNRGPDLAMTCHPPPQGTAAKASALTKKPAHGWPSCCVERVAYGLRRVRALVFGIRLPVTFPQDRLASAPSSVLVSEVSSRTVTPRDTACEHPGTDLLRVLGETLRHPCAAAPRRVPGNGHREAGDGAARRRVRRRGATRGSRASAPARCWSESRAPARRRAAPSPVPSVPHRLPTDRSARLTPACRP